MDQVQELFERVVNVAQGAALMTQTQMRWEITMAFSDYVPNRTLAEVVDQCLWEIGAPVWTEADYRLAAQFLQTYPEPTRREMARALEPFLTGEELAELGSGSRWTAEFTPLTPRSADVSPDLPMWETRPVRSQPGYAHGGDSLLGECGAFLAEYGIFLLSHWTERDGHSCRGADAQCLAPAAAAGPAAAGRGERAAQHGERYRCPLPEDVKPPVGRY